MNDSDQNQHLLAPKTDQVEFDGVKYTIFQCKFADCIFILISETGAVGSMMEVCVEEHEVNKDIEYDIRTVLGQRDEEYLQLLARKIMEIKVKDECRKPLRLGGGLKNVDINKIKKIVEYFENNNVWKY
eukprot:TRINITY_DN5418_c0_g3_i1.p2 TRINITY_DN5418_c0_g3~~TRINITY_DN5418_c0_g3_i1.p2  ORF type:complete len:129 (-),score=11.34 TRINITY_DN5418_c0_g3_i1:204-590(-)